MSKERIWGTKVFELKIDFYIYLSVECDETHSPQEIKKDLEDFKIWMLEKHCKKTIKEGNFFSKIFKRNIS